MSNFSDVLHREYASRPCLMLKFCSTNPSNKKIGCVKLPYGKTETSFSLEQFSAVLRLFETSTSLNEIHFAMSKDTVCDEMHSQCSAVRRMFKCVGRTNAILALRKGNLQFKEECLQRIFAPAVNMLPYAIEISHVSNDNAEFISRLFSNHLSLGFVKKLHLEKSRFEKHLRAELCLALKSSQCRVLTMTGIVCSASIITCLHSKKIWNQNLRRLSIQHCDVGLGTLSNLLIFLTTQHNTLTHFDLYTAVLDDRLFGLFSNYLASSCCMLKSLSIQNDCVFPMHAVPRLHDFEKFRDSLAVNSTLQSLTLRDNSPLMPIFLLIVHEIVLQNNSLKQLSLGEIGDIENHASIKLIGNALESNFSLLTFELFDEGDLPFVNSKKINHFLDRNLAIDWNRILWNKIVDFCIGMAALRLPQYVLLWIFDFLPWMEHVNHRKKIKVIEAVVASCRKIYKQKERQSDNKLLKK